MTPQFTTPCYVRIEDADKRKEICEQLKNIGYVGYLSATLDTFYWMCTYLTDDNKYDPYILGEDFEDAPDNSIDCGTNTELFLALASMRSDTDEGQWFVSIEPNGMRRQFWDSIPSNRWRKATPAEIIEHFNNK